MGAEKQGPQSEYAHTQPGIQAPLPLDWLQLGYAHGFFLCA